MTKKPIKQHRAPTGEVRIIAGRYRGRKLPVLDAEGLRPTGDRIKERLFNWLMNDIIDARCLDVFAGSGSLGFEALSRHAAFVQFFELNPQAHRTLAQNLTRLGADNAALTQGDSLTLLQTPPHTPFNIVFLDPPFHQNLIAPTLHALTQHHWLAANALIYIESEATLTALCPPKNWQLVKEKTSGAVCSRLYRVV
ncbi:16S rRNA (guanine(966)-N(2))-methyltransferase RsmD [Pasteurellaceae bacterium HPA106]|uniref:16S rRNA (guanine(966)-N(2))-methyltransferase RsmD n=1 Tax=Spirabiliibacterium pneumoniae TaxID=221400 RepID=UPI001AAD13B0|nr:16S rRNA (guanine(966)-N(2))-methyltransferase RsmD [Spirabiliibacterium pneumoniae]MBE2896882.1 16S rRNA (guanine(966)-N(2))-methyltransferase RsmD [Spirabiliibacterium pneumoniae]